MPSGALPWGNRQKKRLGGLGSVMRTRTWFRIHSFTGVITGLLLFVVCWSGTFATLAHEIDWLVTPAMQASPEGGSVNWPAVYRSVREAYPKVQVHSLQAPLNRRAAARVVIRPPDQPRRLIYVDPSTATIQGESSLLTVQRFFRSFHRRLFLPNPLGIYVVSVFAVTLLVSMVAALYFYKRWWTRFFRFRPGRRKAIWSELHKTGGLWSVWFVVLMVVTSIWYGLEATGAPHALLAHERETTTIETDPAARQPFGTLLARAQAARPELDVRNIVPPGSYHGDNRLRIEGQGSDLLLRDRVNFAAVATDGSPIGTGSGADLTAFEYWVHMADPLHFGDFAGLTSKLIWFVFGLLLSGLILTGSCLHARRLAREAGGRARHRWPGTGGAMVASLVVLAASVPHGLDEVRSYGPIAHDVQQFPALAPGVKAVIVGWLALTLAIIAVWVWLLWRAPSVPAVK